MQLSKRIPISHPLLEGNEKKYVNECLDTTWISSQGRFIELFEKSFALFCDVGHAMACNNGTTALHVALLALGVQPGDEVIVPTLTYIATANAVRYCGATPVFVDSEANTMNLDPERIEELISHKTKGILPVHLYGHPAEMDSILDIARRKNLFVLEDAAEAHGALHRGRKVGGLGDAATFSFFGNKIITTGEGGMVTTSRPDIEARVRLLRGQGMDLERRFWFPVVGYNYRMTNIAAAIGLAQLESIEQHLAAHQRVAGWYQKHLCALQDFLVLPRQEPWAHHAYWLYTVRLKPSVRLARDQVMARLAEARIETRPVFYPMHIMPPYRDASRSFPISESSSARGICLPTHGLLSEEDVEYIASQFDELCSA